MIEKLTAKTAKNLLEHKTCVNCAFKYFISENQSYRCLVFKDNTDPDNSCPFWLTNKFSENWKEYVKQNGFTLSDIQKYWIDLETA